MNSFRMVRRLIRKAFSLREEDRSETGIGVLIVFIAMVLVAAVAASVLIHTAGILQQKATSTGSNTIQQVSSGIATTEVLGYDYANPPESGGITYLAIIVTTNSGGSPVNLANVTLTLTIDGTTAILVYNQSIFADISSTGSDNLFGLSVWSELGRSHNNPTSFGVIVIKDPSSSMTSKYPVLSPDDQAAIILNVTNTFGTNISQGASVEGQVTPETGASAQIEFTAPQSFVSRTITLQ